MKNKKGFTLAEVLIVLVVIGIIAAITISVINSNIRKAEVETKLKRTVSILNGALQRAIADHGDPSAWPELKDTDREHFDKYFLPYLITLKPPTRTSMRDLGYRTGIAHPSKSESFHALALGHSGKRVFLNDGTIILNSLTSYTTINGTKYIEYTYTIDINGSKGPNFAGKDVFDIGFDQKANSPIIRMYGMIFPSQTENGEWEEFSWDALKSNCIKNGQQCGALIQRNGWKVPKDYPLKI